MLRELRGADEAGFDSAWAALGDGLPSWLCHLDDNPGLVEALIAWVQAPSMDDAEALAREHADLYLGAPAEAAIEHLVDANPGHGALVLSAQILASAREVGIEQTYRRLRANTRQAHVIDTLQEWLAATTPQRSRELAEAHAGELLTDGAHRLLADGLATAGAAMPLVLGHLGLLGLCRTRGVAAAYELLEVGPVAGGDAGDPPADDTSAAEDAISLARLLAGFSPDDGHAQLLHAIAALDAGLLDEARRAAAACSRQSASWERKAHARELGERTAATHAGTPHIATLQRLLLTAHEDPNDA